MATMIEDDFLMLLGQLNVRIGKLNPSVVKAWFDTDCEDLLNWLCTSITEECYISAQEDIEYAHLDTVFINDQLHKRVKTIETEFPDLFEVKSNVLDIEIAKETILVLEEELNDCNHQININEHLCQSLSAELSQISVEEIKSQLEEESAQENCLKLSSKLDEINHQTYEQIVKYNFYLNKYEFAEFPEFINNMDITEFKDKFINIINSINSTTRVDSDLLEVSTGQCLTNEISELENRIFHTRISYLALKMEVAGLNSIMKFFESYNFNTLLSIIDNDSVLLTVQVSRDEQNCMLKVLEENSLKQAEQYINEPTLLCLENELNFCVLRMNYLIKCQESLTRILLHFIIMYNLYLQEKSDINSSCNFFRSICKYVNKDLQDCKLRKEAMLKLSAEYETFNSKPIEDSFKLIGDFGIILSKKKLSLAEVLQGIVLLKNNNTKLKRRLFSTVDNSANSISKIQSNIHILQDFLICGPTCKIVAIPDKLQTLLFKIDQNLVCQKNSVKLLLQASQNSKDKLSQDKWTRYKSQLWMYYVTDYTRMLSLLDQLKTNANHIEAQNL